MSSCKISARRNGNVTGYSTSFFGFPLPIFIPPLPAEVYYRPDQATHYHDLDILAEDFTSDPAVGCLWSKEVDPVLKGCNQTLEQLARQVRMRL
jgi:hypothetical protein